MGNPRSAPTLRITSPIQWCKAITKLLSYLYEVYADDREETTWGHYQNYVKESVSLYSYIYLNRVYSVMDKEMVLLDRLLLVRLHFYRPQEKVLFSAASVSHSVHRGVCIWAGLHPGGGSPYRRLLTWGSGYRGVYLQGEGLHPGGFASRGSAYSKRICIQRGSSSRGRSSSQPRPILTSSGGPRSHCNLLECILVLCTVVCAYNHT